MIRITVELLQYGNPLRGKTIGEIAIANDGYGDGRHGNYDVRVRYEEDIGALNENTGTWVKVVGYDRAKGWLPLLHQALEEVLHDGETSC